MVHFRAYLCSIKSPRLWIVTVEVTCRVRLLFVEDPVSPPCTGKHCINDSTEKKKQSATIAVEKGLANDQ